MATTIYTITGRARDAGGKPVADLLVEAFDSDMGSADDFLGSALTNKLGNFRIKFSDTSFKGKYEILEREPDVYLVISDEYGVVKKRTETRSNARNLKFDVRITADDDDLPYHDPYVNASQRMLALFAAAGDGVVPALIDPAWTATLMMRSITSYMHYADPKIARLYGYPGPQVIARPKEFPKHSHVISWRRTK